MDVFKQIETIYTTIQHTSQTLDTIQGMLLLQNFLMFIMLILLAYIVYKR